MSLDFRELEFPTPLLGYSGYLMNKFLNISSLMSCMSAANGEEIERKMDDDVKGDLKAISRRVRHDFRRHFVFVFSL